MRTIRWRPLIALLCLLIALRPAAAQPRDVPGTAIDKLFATWDRRDSPGCMLAVIHQGKIVHQRGYGMADLDHAVPIGPETVFNIASVSKQFTVFLIMLLAQAGLLSLDDDVRKHVPELPNFGKVITIRHLIHHTSGLREDWSLLGLAGWRSEDLITQKDVLNLVFRQKDLNFNPGNEHLYCNSGYQLLALIAQRVGGQPFQSLAQEKIFQPLNMKHTRFVDDAHAIVAHRASSYGPRTRGGFQRILYGSGRAGPGNLHTTVGDLALWDQNFFEPKVGSAKLIQQIQQKGKLNDGKEIAYAGGLVVRTYRGLPIVEHGGSVAGYRSVFLRFPEQRFSVIILANLSTMNPGSLARKVADVYLAKELPSKPAPAKSVVVRDEILDAQTGEYRLSSGTLLQVRRVKDGLIAQASPLNLPLRAESETDFRGGDGDNRLTLKDGKIILETALATQIGHKVKRPSLQPKQLAEFAGTFLSDELGVLHVAFIRDGKLILRHPKDESVLTPLAIDEFSAPGASAIRVVRFTRRDDRMIDGLLIDTGRARNIRLRKVALP